MMKKNNESGQTMVEFALAFPLLAVMLFAIIQYGFIFSAQITLRHAAQVTSRTMALAGGTTNNVNDVAQSALGPLLNANNLQPAEVALTTVGGVNAYQVTLRYDLPLVIKFVVPNATGNIVQLNATGIDRVN